MYLKRAAFIGLVGTQLTVLAEAATLKTVLQFPANDDGASPTENSVSLGNFLFGTTKAGGRYFQGTIFREDPATGEVTTLYSFTGGKDGAAPNGLLTLNGLLYGTTASGGTFSFSGTAFSFDPTAAKLTTLHSFDGGADGNAPASGAMVSVDGILYGATASGGAGSGTLFSLDPSTGTETVIHAFGGTTDGATPGASPVQLGNALYGTTQLSGAANTGTIYRFDLSTRSEVVVHTFTTSSPLSLVAVGSTLYGTTVSGNGTIFGFNTASGVATTLYNFTYGQDGGLPFGRMTYVDGKLYGTTAAGGGNTVGGTVYSLDPVTPALTTVYRFADAAGSGPGGAAPYAGLTLSGGLLYGSTASGGTAGHGTLFSLDPGTPSLVKLHDFTGTSVGFRMNTGLVGGPNAYYGTTPDGGTFKLGSAFRFDVASETLTTLHSFSGGQDGMRPRTALASAGGALYGTTFGGNGGLGYGTIFKLTGGGTLTTLHTFTGGADGQNPLGAVFTSAAGLYGTTANSTYMTNGDPGTGGGTFYNLQFKDDGLTTLHSFVASPDGQTPLGNLTKVATLLYGVTVGGGVNGTGAIFTFDPATNKTTIVHSFAPNSFSSHLEGAFPQSGLTAIGTKLYGVSTIGGPNYEGTLFSFDTANSTFQVAYAFGGGTGTPSGGLAAAGNTLYGTTRTGGTTGSGSIFSLNTSVGKFNVLYNFSGGADGASPQANLSRSGSIFYGTTSLGGTNNRGTIFSFKP